jgi:hypothetical protein
MNICLGHISVDYNGARADEREKHSTYHTITIPVGLGRCYLRRTGASTVSALNSGSYRSVHLGIGERVITPAALPVDDLCRIIVCACTAFLNGFVW